MQEVALQAAPRHETGKGPAHRLRAQGLVPAIVYGLKKPNMSVTIARREIEHLIHEHGGHAMVALTVGDGGDVEHIIMRETQRDPVTDQIIHVDFHRIDPTQTIDIEVPIRTVGTPKGVKEGGLLEQILRELEVRCLPGNMPQYISVDVTDVGINESLSVAELVIPEDVEVLTDMEAAVFTVVPPVIEEEEEEEEEVTEPEVVGEEKEEEEGEEGEEEKKEKEKEEKE